MKIKTRFPTPFEFELIKFLYSIYSTSRTESFAIQMHANQKFPYE
jgi:hypothetical protein